MYSNIGLLTVDNNIYKHVLCITFYTFDKLNFDDYNSFLEGY